MRIAPLLLILTLAPFSLVGCGSDTYSSAIVYGVRQDPLILDDGKLGDERFEPDRPGVLPLLLAKDMNNLHNPFFAKKDEVFKNGWMRDPAKLRPEHRNYLDSTLRAYFGRPGTPQVVGLDTVTESVLKLDSATLTKGSQLYRLHCLHCHGVAGDGRGPTGRWVNPHPRDYRLGIFKFMSVDQTDNVRPPSRADLLRTLRVGIDGTAMPAFNMLPDEELQQLVSYIIHLSLRGKVEFETIKNAFKYDEKADILNLDDKVKGVEANFLDKTAGEFVAIYAKNWLDSQTSLIPISPYPFTDFDGKSRSMTAELRNSIKRGQKLFLGEGAETADDMTPSQVEAKKADCVSCHIDYGRQAKYKFDAWGTLTRPQNLTQPIRRGGSRPADIYYRIHSGISGSGMVAKGKNLEAQSIWDLANFVQTLPYPAMRKAAGIEID